MKLISEGKAPRIVQSEVGASYEPYITAKPELAEIDWSKLKTQHQLHNFIRGCDSVPGAWTRLNGQKVALFGSSLWKRFDVRLFKLLTQKLQQSFKYRKIKVPGNAREVETNGAPSGKVWAHDKGLLFRTDDGRYVSVENVKIDDGRMIKANRFGNDLNAVEERLELTPEEKNLVETLKVIRLKPVY